MSVLTLAPQRHGSNRNEIETCTDATLRLSNSKQFWPGRWVLKKCAEQKDYAHWLARPRAPLRSPARPSDSAFSALFVELCGERKLVCAWQRLAMFTEASGSVHGLCCCAVARPRSPTGTTDRVLLIAGPLNNVVSALLLVFRKIQVAGNALGAAPGAASASRTPSSSAFSSRTAAAAGPGAAAGSGVGDAGSSSSAPASVTSLASAAQWGGHGPSQGHASVPAPAAAATAGSRPGEQPRLSSYVHSVWPPVQQALASRASAASSGGAPAQHWDNPGHVGDGGDIDGDGGGGGGGASSGFLHPPDRSTTSSAGLLQQQQQQHPSLFAAAEGGGLVLPEDNAISFSPADQRPPANASCGAGGAHKAAAGGSSTLGQPMGPAGPESYTQVRTYVRTYVCACLRVCVFMHAAQVGDGSVRRACSEKA
jgi:hypothetical protein